MVKDKIPNIDNNLLRSAVDVCIYGPKDQKDYYKKMHVFNNEIHDALSRLLPQFKKDDLNPRSMVAYIPTTFFRARDSITNGFDFQQRFRMAQIGGLAMFFFMKPRYALLGALGWAYYACPEIYTPFTYKAAGTKENISYAMQGLKTKEGKDDKKKDKKEAGSKGD